MIYPSAVLERFRHTADWTQGALYVRGVFVCFILEDPPQPIKVPGNTRIPAGIYQLGIRRGSPMADRYDARFPDHDGMVWILDVPGFEWVYFHAGNKADHTRGCPLAGDSLTAAGTILGGTSGPAYLRAYRALRPLAEAGEWLSVTDIREQPMEAAA